MTFPLTHNNKEIKNKKKHKTKFYEDQYSSPPLQWKSGLIRGVASHEGDNLLLFYYLSSSEIWPDKNRGVVFGVRGLIRRGLLYTPELLIKSSNIVNSIN